MTVEYCDQILDKELFDFWITSMEELGDILIMEMERRIIWGLHQCVESNMKRTVGLAGDRSLASEFSKT